MANGVTNGDTMVEQAVMVTDKATLPRAKKVITFEATPPGQEPTNTTPAATSGGKRNRIANPAPKIGMIENCKNMPIMTVT